MHYIRLNKWKATFLLRYSRKYALCPLVVDQHFLSITFYHYLTVCILQTTFQIASSMAVYTLFILLSFPIFLPISLSFSLILYLFLFCLFSCPFLLIAPVGTEYGNAIRTTESPSVCGKLNTLSNDPCGLGLQNREGGHGRSGVRERKRADKKWLKGLVVVCPEVLAVWVCIFIELKVSKQYMSSYWAYSQ